MCQRLSPRLTTAVPILGTTATPSGSIAAAETCGAGPEAEAALADNCRPTDPPPSRVGLASASPATLADPGASGANGAAAVADAEALNAGALNDPSARE